MADGDAGILGKLYGPKMEHLRDLARSSDRELRLMDLARRGDAEASALLLDETMQSPFMGFGVGNIKAYHGSPHAFTKFSTKHIGKGEGAQAYGHGLYFAENPKVAQQYQKALAAKQYKPRADMMRFGNKPLSEMPEFKSITDDLTRAQFANMLDKHRGDGVLAAHEIRNWGLAKAEKQPGLTAQIMKNVDAAARAGEKIGRSGKQNYTRVPDPKGRLYEVNLKPDPEDFLDWDKPLRSLSFAQRARLRQAWPDVPGGTFEEWVKDGATGADLYNLGANALKKEGMAAYEDMSKRLYSAGIRGIRYKDAGSRGGEKGTHNYVVFDEADIEMLGVK